MSETVIVRTMQPADGPGLVTLFQEMQAYYRVPCPPAERIAADLANLPHGVDVLVAAEPAIVGFAAICTLFPGPGLRPGYFLKELFVAERVRGRGVGTRLLRAVARSAVERGFARIDWTADRGDTGLLAYYRSTGAAEQPEKLFFRLAGEDLERFAQEGSAGRLGKA